MSSPLVRYGANFQIVGKTDPQKVSYAGGFKPVMGTIADLAAHISEGHSWMPAILDKGKPRWQQHANYAELAAIDIDGGMSIAEAIAHPFGAAYCCLGIESASSNAELEKFRLVFRFHPARRPQGWETVRICNQYLIHQFKVADPACKDASRFFFGAPGREPFLLNETATLPQSFVQDAIAWHQAIELEEQRRAELTCQWWEKQRRNNADALSEVERALGDVSPYKPGEGRYSSLVAMIGGVLSVLGEAEGSAILRAWDGGRGQWGRGGFERILRSVSRSKPSKKATLGTLFYLAQQEGYRPPKREWKDPREPNQAEYNEFTAQTKGAWLAVNAVERDRQQQQRLEKFKKETDEFQAWASRLDLEPTLVVSDRYLPAGTLPDKPGIVLIDAPMGTGKTSSYVKGLVDQQAKLHPEGKFISLGSRNSLQYQTVKLYGGLHHNEYTSADEMMRDRWWVGCFDSIWKFVPDRITPGSILFLDELSAGADHLLDGSTIGDKRVFATNRLKAIAKAVIAKGGWIVASEDGITNLELELLKELAGEVPITFVKSKWKSENPWQIDLYDSGSIVWDELRERLARGESLILCSDSAKWLRETERFICDGGLASDGEVWVLDGNSSHEDWAHSFVTNPDQWIKLNRPKVFAYSPSIESGVSITEPHFDAMGFYFVNLPPRALRQMPARYRLPIPRFGYVKDFAVKPDDSCKSLNPDAILRDLRKTTEGIAKLTAIAEFVAQKQAEQTGEGPDLSATLGKMLSGEDPDEAFWLKHWARIKARQNHGRSNLLSQMWEGWEKAGHQVHWHDYGPNTALVEYRKEIGEQLQIEEAKLFARTDGWALSIEEARQILDSPGSTPEDRRMATKRLRLEQLPGCDLSDADFVLKVLIKDRGKFLKSTQLLWAVQNPEAQKEIDRLDLFGKIQRQSRRGEIVWAPGVKTTALKADLIARSPLLDCIIPEAYTEDSEAVQQFREWALWNRAEIRRVMRLTIKEDHSGAKILNKFLRKLGFDLVEFKRGPRKAQIRYYQIANYSDIDRDAILAALSAKFKERSRHSEKVHNDTVSATCAIDPPLQVADTISPASAESGIESPIDNGWYAPESLIEVREWYSNPEVWDSMRWVVPAEVLERAIAS